MEELTLEQFEEASDLVKEVTLETKLVYSEYFSAQTGNKVYFKPENLQYTGAYKVLSLIHICSSFTFRRRSSTMDMVVWMPISPMISVSSISS